MLLNSVVDVTTMQFLMVIYATCFFLSNLHQYVPTKICVQYYILY